MPNTYNFLDENGLLYYSLLIKTELNKKLESADLASVENKIPSTIIITPNPNNVSLALTSTNGTGTATTFPAVSTTNAGVMLASDKTKLDGIEAGALVNIINRIRIGTGSPLTVSNDGTIFIPIDGIMYGNQQGESLVTNSNLISRLNGLGSGLSYDISQKANINSPEFTGTPTAPTPASGTNNTQIATTAFVQSAIAAAVTGSFKFVNTLPLTGEEGYIYLVPHTHAEGSTNTNPDVKDEYIWNTSTTPALWELIGNTDLDLSTHWAKSELTSATNNEILAIWNSVWTTNELENNG